MGKLLNLDYNYYEASCPFSDVYDWARGWVGACYANGYVSGRGDGIYDPGTTVTAVEAASMLMRVLGYFKYQSDIADGFEVATVRQATKIGLFDGVDSQTNAPLTRNQVAQMALNALQSGMVEPDGNALNFIDANGNVIATGGKVNYVFVTSNKPFAKAIDSTPASSMGSTNDAPIVELGEQLYDGKLKLTDTADAFGRPSRYWEFDAKEIGTYVKEELIRQTYTAKVTGKALYDLLGKTIIDDYDLDVFIDGEDDPSVNTAVFDARYLVRTYGEKVGATGNGVLTQVFVDPDDGPNGTITITVINTYLAIADEDFDDRTDDLDITVYGIDEVTKDHYVKKADNTNGTSDGQKEGFTLEIEDFPEITTAKDGDAYLVNVAEGEVQIIAKPEILNDAQVTSFKVGDWLVTGGTQYDFASAAEYECESLYDWTAVDNAVVNLKEIKYNVYLDKYGYAIGVEEVERVNNYVFITGVDTDTNNRYAEQANASGIFLDGTMETMKIDMRAARDLKDYRNEKDSRTYEALTNGDEGGSLVNKWFTYTVGDDGVYKVVLVGSSDDIDNDQIKARAGQFRTLTKEDNTGYIENGDSSHESYTVDNAGAGTLVENYNPNVVAALGGTHGVEEVDGPKSIALRGSSKRESPWYSVYGNDDSIYITAELNTIIDSYSKSKERVNIIGGVDNVSVGIDNTSIDVWSRAEALTQGDYNNVGEINRTAHGVYTLFDKDGDVIAAVVVGEDSGTVTNLVYTHKGMESETDNGASSSTRASSVKGTYTWTRKVVSNGEEVLLTEVGSGLSELKSMEKYTWYVVKYNAKGEVKNVYPAWDNVNFKGLIDAAAKDAPDDKDRLEDRYVNNIEELNQATNEERTVLYEVGRFNNVNDLRRGKINRIHTAANEGPTVSGKTFFLTTATGWTGDSLHQGFRVSDDVKTVFIQKNNRDETTSWGSGYNDLVKFVDRLHDYDELGDLPDGYNYEISAIMENGKAVVVVIHDLNGAGAVIGPVTGKYTVKFQPGFWSDERNVFYVGVNKLDYANGDFTNYDSTYDSFRVPASEHVQVVRRNATDERFNEGLYTDEANKVYAKNIIVGRYDKKNSDGSIRYIVASVNNTGRTIDFQVDGDCTLFSPLNFWVVPTVTPVYKGTEFAIENNGVTQVFDGGYYEMWIRDANHKTGDLPRAASDDDKLFVKGNTYKVTVTIKKTEMVNNKIEVTTKTETVPVTCEDTGFLLARIPVSVTSLNDNENIVITLKDVVKTAEGNTPVEPDDPDKPDVKIEAPAAPEINVSGVKVGSALPKADDGENYTAVTVWKDENGEEVKDATFTEGGKYTYTVTLTAKDGFTFAGGKTYTYDDVEVDVKDEGGEQPVGPAAGTGTYTAGGTNVTLSDNAKAGEALVVTVTGMPTGNWFKIVGGSLNSTTNRGAAENVDGTLRFRYTPSAAEVSSKSVSFTFTKFNATESDSDYVYTLGTDGTNMILDPIPNLTSYQASTRSIKPGHTAGAHGDYAEMVIGTGAGKLTLKGYVNANGVRVFPVESAARAKEIIDQFNELVPDDEGYVAVATSTSAVTVGGGDETVLKPNGNDGYMLTIWMDKPKSVGVKLPNTVTITDDKGADAITANVEWTYDGGTMVLNKNGDYFVQPDQDVNLFSYRILYPEIVNEEKNYFPIEINTSDGNTFNKTDKKEDFEKCAITPNNVVNNASAAQDPSQPSGTVQNNNTFTFNYYKTRPTQDYVVSEIKRLTGAEVVSVTLPADDHTKTTINDGNTYIKPTKEGAVKESIIVVLNPQAKVWYNDEVIAYADKDGTAEPVGSFKANDVLLVVTDKTIRIGQKATLTGTQVSVTPTAYADEENTGDDDIYIYDAINVTKGADEGSYKAMGSLAEWERVGEAEEALTLATVQGYFTAGSLVVRPGVKLNPTGAATGNKNDVVELRFNKTSFEEVKTSTRANDNTAINWTAVEITSDMADKNNVVVLAEYGPIVTVSLDGVEYTVVSGQQPDAAEINKSNPPKNALYLAKEDNGKTTDPGTAVFVVINAYGKLDTTNTQSISANKELVSAYKLSAEADIITTGTADQVKYRDTAVSNVTANTLDGAKTTTTLTAAGAAMIPGTQVYVIAADAGTELTAEGVELTRCKALDDHGRYGYYFTMPEKPVVIKKGSSITVNSNDVDINNLYVPDQTASFDVVLNGVTEGATLAIGDPQWVIAVGSQTANTAQIDIGVSIGAPKAGTNKTTWTVSLTSPGDKGIPVGHYFLNLAVTVDGKTTNVVKDINVGVPTVTLTVPTNFSFTTSNGTADQTTGTIEVGTEVTVKIADSEKYYIKYNGAFYKGDESFIVKAENLNDIDLSNLNADTNKYYKVSMADTSVDMSTKTSNLGGMTITASISDWKDKAEGTGDARYVLKGGKIEITFALDTSEKTGKTTSIINAKLAGDGTDSVDGSVSANFGTAAELMANTSEALTKSTDTVTVDGSKVGSTADVKLSYTLS